MVDRTGLRPTTDGSAGSEQAALEDMNKNYPKQQQSVPHLAPEPPKPETPKSSKPSSTPKPSTSTPSHIKHYNPDHNEFEPPATIQSVTSVAINIATDYIFDRISNYVGSVAGEAARQTAISTNPISGMQLAPVSGNLPNFATNADDISRYVAKVTSGVTKVAGHITGGILDYSLQVYMGENTRDAFIKSAFHVGIGVAMAAIGLSTIATFALTLVATMAFDWVYDNADIIKGYLSKTFSFA